ncbi:MAG: hypothetical protein J3K34DRAFT_403970 [Monoraphidium minutum]|nr:MAG: hypothetical protein J3K34DRAFT_403970 [Monoraphidium minutum]
MAAIMQRSATNKMAKASAVLPRLAPRARLVVVRAEQKNGVAQFADSIGLPTEEGIFGFRPFAEVWVGRLAMMGFVTSIVEEAMTGQGTLRQIGLTPSPGLLTAMLVALGGAVTVGAGATAAKLAQRKMTAKDVARYKNFLGLNNANDFIEAANAMKRKGDFTSPDDMAAIAAAKAAGAPADAFLSTSEVADGAAAAAAMKGGDGGATTTMTKEREAAEAGASARPGYNVPQAAKGDILAEPMFSTSFEKQYARDVEVTNGRAAMLGFLAAVLVEAATDKGIIMQIIMWLKITGFLGAASGF